MGFYDEPNGYTIFCDDVRIELGNKPSFMGVYTSGMFVPSFPLFLPKFVLGVSFWEPRAMAEKREKDLKLIVTLPEGNQSETTEFTIPKPKPEEIQNVMKSNLAPDPDVKPLIGFFHPFLISPLVATAPGRIKVRAEYEGTIIRLGSMKIDKGTAIQGP